MDTTLLIAGLAQVQDEQMLTLFNPNYPLQQLFISQGTKSGQFTQFYRPYDSTTDNHNGTEDVTIGDYNPSVPTVSQTVYKVDSSISKKMRIYSDVINEFTFSPALFNTLLNDVGQKLILPLTRENYIRQLGVLKTELSTADSIEIVNTGAASAASDAKIIHNKLIELLNPNPNYIIKAADQTVTGAKDLTIEKTTKSDDLLLVLDKNYGAQYKYDLAANTFNRDDIKLPIPIENVLIVDMSAIAKYVDLNVDIGFIVEKGAFKNLIHYKQRKAVITPKLYDVITEYWRMKNIRIYDKYLIKINKKA